MKKVLFVLAVFALSVMGANAQNNKVYGPKAKNQKVWINKSEKSTVVNKDKTNITGATAKNNQVWVKGCDTVPADLVSTEGKTLTFKKKLAQKNYDRQHNNEKAVDYNNPEENLTQK